MKFERDRNIGKRILVKDKGACHLQDLLRGGKMMLVVDGMGVTHRLPVDDVIGFIECELFEIKDGQGITVGYFYEGGSELVHNKERTVAVGDLTVCTEHDWTCRVMSLTNDCPQC